MNTPTAPAKTRNLFRSPRAAGFTFLYPPGTPLDRIVGDLRAHLRPESEEGG